MSSLIAPIEVAPLSDVQTTDTLLTVTLSDGRAISIPIEWYPRLAYATPQERGNWRPIADGEGIHWPELDEDISVEGLVAGRKSGESAASLKKWMAIQDQLRQMPRDFPGLRRQLLTLGRLSPDEIFQQARSTIEAYDSRPEDWSVAVALDPFELLRASGCQDESPCAVYKAESAKTALEVKARCAALGMRDATLAGPEPDRSEFVLLFSTKVP